MVGPNLVGIWMDEFVVEQRRPSAARSDGQNIIFDDFVADDELSSERAVSIACVSRAFLT